MPKRERSQFEPIPVFNLLSERSRQGYLGNRSEMNASLNRGVDSQLRINRVIQRTHNFFLRALPLGWVPPNGLYYDAILHEVRMNLIRRFGVVNDEDAAYFFEHSGRGSYVLKSWRRSIDRRRREAYIILRSWLPMEVVRRILQFTPSWNALN